MEKEWNFENSGKSNIFLAHTFKNLPKIQYFGNLLFFLNGTLMFFSNADLKIFLYVLVHTKIIHWKIRILNSNNSRVVYS